MKQDKRCSTKGFGTIDSKGGMLEEKPVERRKRMKMGRSKGEKRKRVDNEKRERWRERKGESVEED